MGQPLPSVSPFRVVRSLPTNGSLRAYFYSGWAFFIPYLAAYLLYAGLKWPVNPAPFDGPPSTIFGPPCLIHIYWALHLINLLFAAVALRSWWRSSVEIRLPSTTLSSLAPWLCLSLLFWIPGVYLEWPSDPWEHLRRINEWHDHNAVRQHSSWYKSSYFLPYSLSRLTTGFAQLTCLNFYYTGACLLLCWQYYRLALAIGMGTSASLLFVIVNAITFGNTIFSFFRYYGLSSSIFAQLGAVALTRIAVETLRSRIRKLDQQPPAGPIINIWTLAFSVPCLTTLIAFHHIQGIGIAGLGILAVIIWRLIEWKRTMIFWLAGGAVVLSAAAIWWFPRHAALDEIYRPRGWLAGWYGFNFFSTSSPTFDRALQIVGAFGVLNLLLGLWLIVRRNHVAGWLVLTPVIALALPCFALPFAHVLASQTDPGNIITFHRMLMAMPMGLALVAILLRGEFADAPAVRQRPSPRPSSPALRSSAVYTLVYIGLIGSLALPSGSYAYNRFWHSLVITPGDQRLDHYIADRKPAFLAQTEHDDVLIIDTPLGHQIQQVFLPDNNSWEYFRLIDTPIVGDSLEHRIGTLDATSSLFAPAPINTNSAQLNRFDFLRHEAVPHERGVAAPTSTDHSWIALGGSLPQHSFANGQLTVSNQVGHASQTFNRDLTPVSRYKRYHLTSKIRQTGSTAATNYLAVAWYDRNGQLLQSILSRPEGAGDPRGWINGTYSYYGLVDQAASTKWATYAIDLGLGETASIPANAAYLRIGALLNYHATPEAKVEIMDVTLVEKPIQSHLILVFPGFWHLYTPVSQAALMSQHWPARYVPTAHAGTKELRARSSDH